MDNIVLDAGVNYYHNVINIRNYKNSFAINIDIKLEKITTCVVFFHLEKFYDAECQKPVGVIYVPVPNTIREIIACDHIKNVITIKNSKGFISDNIGIQPDGYYTDFPPEIILRLTDIIEEDDDGYAKLKYMYRGDHRELSKKIKPNQSTLLNIYPINTDFVITNIEATITWKHFVFYVTKEWRDENHFDVSDGDYCKFKIIIFSQIQKSILAVKNLFIFHEI